MKTNMELDTKTIKFLNSISGYVADRINGGESMNEAISGALDDARNIMEKALRPENLRMISKKMSQRAFIEIHAQNYNQE